MDIILSGLIRMTDKKILVFFDYFYPAVKAGGPIRTSKGFAELLSSTLDIDIITRAFDLGDKKILESIIPNKWLTTPDNYNINYTTSLAFFRILLKSLTRKYDCIYLNSFFSLRFTIIPLILWKFRSLFNPSSIRIVIAPRGEISSYAVGQKRVRKNLYISIFKVVFIRNVIFHATSEHEYRDIKKLLGESKNLIKVANNLRSASEKTSKISFIIKNKNQPLRLISLSRIVSIKNIDFSIKIISGLSFPIKLDIYGPIEDVEYYNKCNSLAIEARSDNIQIDFCGTIDGNEVVSTIQKYHAFLSPSKSENFGHAIFESLLAGRPVIISDKTYWRNLAKNNAGWDIPLSDIEKFREVLMKLYTLNDESYGVLCRGSYHIAQKYLCHERTVGVSQHLALFS